MNPYLIPLKLFSRGDEAFWITFQGLFLEPVDNLADRPKACLVHYIVPYLLHRTGPAATSILLILPPRCSTVPRAVVGWVVSWRAGAGAPAEVAVGRVRKRKAPLSSNTSCPMSTIVSITRRSTTKYLSMKRPTKVRVLPGIIDAWEIRRIAEPLAFLHGFSVIVS